MTKECSQYTGAVGDFCTITSSNVEAITVGSKIFYAQALAFPTLESDIRLVAGPGNTAFGHCHLELLAGVGLCMLSGGTGKFTHVHASVVVSVDSSVPYGWHWGGTYSFSPRED